MSEEKIELVKEYLHRIDLKCGEDIFQSDKISSEVSYILDKVLTILFGEDYNLLEE